VGDEASYARSKLALESRAYPVLRFDPDAGDSWEDCIELDGNPEIDADWPTYALQYEDDDGETQSLELPLTFADFAVGEARFRKHFRVAPQDTWNEHMVPIADFIEQSEDEREGLFPYVWAVNKKNRLIRVLVSEELVQSTQERRDFWRTLKALAGLTKKVDPEKIAAAVRAETAQKLANGLMAMLTGNVGGGAVLPSAPAAGTSATGGGAPDAGDYEAPWIDRNECTSCDECIGINPNIFAYDKENKAYIKDPKGGPYKDIVRAAEKCTGQCIHPGTPHDPGEKDLDKLIKRAEKYQ
jgi:pyruvate-ferredoxin/flavodoxin oxidoreductase